MIGIKKKDGTKQPTSDVERLYSFFDVSLISLFLYTMFHPQLLLMKRGGRVIYGGKVGERSNILIKYFESVNGITPMPSDYNTANWMVEMTTPAAEERLGQDFLVIYKNSKQYRDIEALIQQTSTPQTGSEPLHFSSTYSQTDFSQFRTCLWKQNLVNRSQNLMVVMGALYTAVMFLGVNNSSFVQPVIAIERTNFFYRERAAGMYSAVPYAIAQGLVEIPYIAAQTILYGITTYFMIKFQRTIVLASIIVVVGAWKFFLYLAFMFLTFTYFTFYGMLAIGLAPSQQMADVLIPGWWIWFHYLCPITWTLQGLIGSQLADVEEPIIGPGGFQGTVKGYLKEALGIES
ncbi:ABC transporter G family member 31-like [Lactuca sativa]|uniref:ABC transporter G family member 31-like n=1 Tax=Lactuca sativa TaxID=4236 RepID=UPI0022B0665F|nr:ABC transporter G family member 31-like [Lactuca sativa]